MEVRSGASDESQVGQLVTVNGKRFQSTWGTEACNKLRGTDGALYSPFLTKESEVNIFTPELSRVLELEYDGQETFKNVPGYRFAPKKNTFAPPSANGSNSCYCMEADKSACEEQPNGLFSLSALRDGKLEDNFLNQEKVHNRICQRFYQIILSGAPVFVSFPHFYEGDEFLNKQSGTKLPNKENDQLYILVEPVNPKNLFKSSKLARKNYIFLENKFFSIFYRQREYFYQLILEFKSI